MIALSKSKLLAFCQCPKRLWLELHQPELGVGSQAAQARFAIGHAVGDIARQIYDPKRSGHLVDVQAVGLAPAFQRSAALLNATRRAPVFEAGFADDRLVAFADVLLPVRTRGKPVWRLIEVKSSTEVKDYHRDDVAIQAFAARQAGVLLSSVAIAHVDSSWAYSGDGDYGGLLTEVDLTAEAAAREKDVIAWIDAAHKVARKRAEPKQSTGRHCTDPFECGFFEHCQSQGPQAEYPVAWLPRVRAKALREHIESKAIADLRDVPDGLLNARQLRVKNHTLQGTVYFDEKAAKEDLAEYSLPAYFMDFETVQFAIPIWKGTMFLP